MRVRAWEECANRVKQASLCSEAASSSPPGRDVWVCLVHRCGGGRHIAVSGLVLVPNSDSG